MSRKGQVGNEQRRVRRAEGQESQYVYLVAAPCYIYVAVGGLPTRGGTLEQKIEVWSTAGITG